MYFLTGNLWLIVALFLTLGKTVARTEPTFYSFFGSGAWFEPSSYHGLIGFAGFGAGVSFVLAFRNRKKSADAD